MNERAQAGLEYLMTYGWALILVATIITVLVFIVQFKPTTTFVSSDPTKIMLKSAGVSGGKAGMVLQNATGGKITINSIVFSGDISYAADSTLNGRAPALPMELIAGGEIRLEGLNAFNNAANAGVEIRYKDYAGFERAARVTSTPGAPTSTVLSLSLEGESADSGWSGENLTFGGGVAEAIGVACPSGHCLGFDGTNDYVEVSATENLGDFAGGSFSWSAWYNPKEKPSGFSHYAWHAILCIAHANNSFLAYNNEGRFVIALEDETGSTHVEDSAMAYDTGKWYHIAATVDAVSKKMTLYVNGSMAASGSYGTLRNHGSDQVRIGACNAGTITMWAKGYIDEVAIHNRVLGDSEICSGCRRFAAGAGVTCNC